MAKKKVGLGPINLSFLSLSQDSSFIVNSRNLINYHSKVTLRILVQISTRKKRGLKSSPTFRGEGGVSFLETYSLQRLKEGLGLRLL